MADFAPITVGVGVSDMSRQNITIRVRYSGPLRARFWLAKQLLRFTAWLVGGKADVMREGE